MVAENLSQDQVESIKQMFHTMDTDKNGNLSFEELKDGFHLMGQHVADQDVELLMDAVSIFFNINLFPFNSFNFDDLSSPWSFNFLVVIYTRRM